MSGGNWHAHEEDRLPPKSGRDGEDRLPRTTDRDDVGGWRPSPERGGTYATDPLEQPIRQPLAGENRPVLTVVAGACEGAGTSDLAWALARELAAHGAGTALLADLPVHLASQAAADVFPAGRRFRVVGYDRRPPRELEQAAWRPVDRANLVLEMGGATEAVVIDVGSLAEALVAEPQVLAMADNIVICWPQSPVKLWQAARALNSQRQERALRAVLTRALHCAYLARPDGPDMVAAVLDSVLDNAHNRVVAVEFGRQIPDLAPLLTAIGAHAAGPHEQERQWLDVARAGTPAPKETVTPASRIVALLAAGVVIMGMLLVVIRVFR